MYTLAHLAQGAMASALRETPASASCPHRSQHSNTRAVATCVKALLRLT
jgi:hypothetical protein